MSKKTALFSFISLGCARTLVDSEGLVNALHGAGFQLVEEGSKESLTVLNTCSFIKAAIDETEANIRLLIDKKNSGDLKYLAVVGCYPSRFKKADLSVKFPEVDIWLTTQEESQLKSLLSELVFKEKFTPSAIPPYKKLTPSHYSFLKISEGCDNWCSFCTIPKIRGTHVSKTVDEVVSDAKIQIALGAKELLLIAEDTTAWGEDIYGKPSFHILLDALAQLDVTWIRPMYIFPSRVNKELIDVMTKYPTISNYIDMPIQHVSTPLLKSMNRRHDREFLEKVLNDFRNVMPDIAIRTTLILGYPGETEQDVDDLVQFIEDYPFAHIGCFGYSEEKETRAARIKEKIAPDVIRKRIERVMTRQHELVEQRNKARIGQTLDIVIDRADFGRSEYEAPEVDGGIRIQSDKVLVPGHVHKGTIIDAKGYDLVATI